MDMRYLIAWKTPSHRVLEKSICASERPYSKRWRRREEPPPALMKARISRRCATSPNSVSKGAKSAFMTSERLWGRQRRKATLEKPQWSRMCCAHRALRALLSVTR